MGHCTTFTLAPLDASAATATQSRHRVDETRLCSQHRAHISCRDTYSRVLTKSPLPDRLAHGEARQVPSFPGQAVTPRGLGQSGVEPLLLRGCMRRRALSRRTGHRGPKNRSTPRDMSTSDPSSFLCPSRSPALPFRDHSRLPLPNSRSP